MTNTSWLPKILRWLFAVFSVISGIAAIAVCAVIVINPNLPATAIAQIGPLDLDFMGQPGTIAVHSSQGDFGLAVTALRGMVTLHADKGGELIRLLKLYGLPLLLVYTAFFAVLFDLLRRLFRNVGRGESFTQQNLRLVQTIGISLLVYSLVSAAGEGLFSYELLSFLSQHTMVSIGGSMLHFPPPDHMTIGGDATPFGSPVFFSGLLVLALSEVFRQGLAIKNENDLTV